MNGAVSVTLSLKKCINYGTCDVEGLSFFRECINCCIQVVGKIHPDQGNRRCNFLARPSKRNLPKSSKDYGLEKQYVQLARKIFLRWRKKQAQSYAPNDDVCMVFLYTHTMFYERMTDVCLGW